MRVKKYHRCIWCAEVIPTGESASRSTLKKDSRLDNVYFHLECEEAYRKIENDVEDGWYPGDFKRGSCECNE
jgi:hypothetical protein